MVIAEIDGIIANLTQKLLGKEPSISLKNIKTKEIPGFISNYFDREAEKWIREESSMFLSSGRFNYDLPDVKKKFDELYTLLKDTAVFNRPKLMRVMDQAVKLQTNFLIQPERTMAQFVYRDDDVITPEEVMDSMKYFVAYAYYYQGLEHYFQTNKMETISKAKFKNFIQQLDEKALSQDKTQTAINVATVIVGFLNLGRAKQSDTIEADALVNAYQDRNMAEYVGAVKNAISKGGTTLSLTQLEEIFKAYFAPKAEAKAVEDVFKVDLTKKVGAGIDEVIKPVYEEKKDVVSTDNLSKLVSQIEDIKEEEPTMASVDSFFEEEDDDDIVIPPPPPPPPVKEEVKPAAKPVEKSKVTVSGEPAGGTAADQLAEAMSSGLRQAASVEDLYKLIEDKDKKTYIKKLFKKKDKEFFEFLNELNACKNWKDANTIIEDTFYNHEVNPYQKEAIEFTDAVYGRYFPKT